MLNFRFWLCALALTCVSVSSQAKYQFSTPALLAAFTAKEYCSCRFVVKQSDEHCRNFVRVKSWDLTKNIQVDPVNYRVSVSFLGGPGKSLIRSSAVLRGEKQGCRLEQQSDWAQSARDVLGAGTRHRSDVICQTRLAESEVAYPWPKNLEIPASATLSQALDTYLFDRPAGSPHINTDAALVLHNGKPIYERYARGYSKDRRHLLWSVSKSVLSTLVGIAVQQNRLRLSDSICRFVSPVDPRHCAISVENLLHWSSGLRWNEGYEEGPAGSSVTALLYGQGRGGMLSFVTEHGRFAEPGELWSYSSGDSNVLMAVLRAAFNADSEFAWKELFEPLGIRSAVWERDGQGVPVASSWLYMTPSDVARVGQLYLQDGVWEERRLLPPGWVKYVSTLAPAFNVARVQKEATDVGGAHWWINQEVTLEKGRARPWPDAPTDTIAARGHWGQAMFVIPSRNLVFVRLGDDRKDGYDFNAMLRLILQRTP